MPVLEALNFSTGAGTVDTAIKLIFDAAQLS